jgi:phosphatidylinositol 3-kinase
LRRQGELIETLASIGRDIKNSKETRPKKVKSLKFQIEQLREFIADSKNGLISFPPLSLPLDPSIQVTGLIPEKSNVFKSNLLPLFLTFKCLDGSEYPVIFKHGDDLRQDQLVLQILSLMNRLLLKENLDLVITPYKVLATGTDHGYSILIVGMIQFIRGNNIAGILAEHQNSLIPYLARGKPFIEKNVMDNYIRSLAGYSVMTYLLGIGDRHLDNILLKEDGSLFHIDFGYILGRDPKFFPPPMKLCKEMLEVVGGTASPNYNEFRSFCFVAFNNLRKSANLILNLFALMVNANIPDIAIEPDKAVLKVTVNLLRFSNDFA